MKAMHLILTLAAALALAACEQPAQQDEEDTPEPDAATATDEPAGTLPREGETPAMTQESETTLQEEVPVEQQRDRPVRETPPEETEDEETVDEPPPRS